MSDTTNPFVTRQNLLQSPDTLATVLHAIMRDKYGDEWYNFDQLTIMMDLQADFNVDPCPAAMDRIGAIQTLMTGDSFFKRIDAFMGVCNAFSSGEPFFGAFDPVTVEEAAWGIAEAGMNRDMLPFSPTIQQYCRIVLRENGYGDDDYPPIFEAIFDDGKATLGEIKRGLVCDENGAALNEFMQEQASDLAAQFDSLADLKNVDDAILRDGLVRALATRKLDVPVAPV